MTVHDLKYAKVRAEVDEGLSNRAHAVGWATQQMMNAAGDLVPLQVLLVAVQRKGAECVLLLTGADAVQLMAFVKRIEDGSGTAS
jgi:hypothetical protein